MSDPTKNDSPPTNQDPSDAKTTATTELDPIEDVKKAFGLLAGAARKAMSQFPTEKIESAVKDVASKIPTQEIENAVMTGAREVSRAFENVGNTIDEQFFKSKKSSPPPADAAAPKSDADEKTPPDGHDAPKGPRV